MQSSRGDRGRFHVDVKVRKWKDAIRPYIQAATTGAPSKLPIRATTLRYCYRLPKTTKKRIVEYVRNGGVIPYLAPADLTDNLSKGVVDVCKGIIFEDDSQIWQMANAEKVYGLADCIELGFEETPDVMLINGNSGASLNVSEDDVHDDGRAPEAAGASS